MWWCRGGRHLWTATGAGGRWRNSSSRRLPTTPSSAGRRRASDDGEADTSLLKAGFQHVGGGGCFIEIGRGAPGRLLPGTGVLLRQRYNKLMSSGFCSEHTTEYLLAPRFVRLFTERGVLAVPLFYWFTREGSAAARLSAPDRDVRVVAVFARRPKLFGRDDAIEIKFNDELFEYASAAQEVGMPVVAGAPIASSVFDLTERCPVSWFAISPDHRGERLVTVDVAPPHRVEPRDRGVRGPLSDDTILEIVGREAATKRWSEVADAFRRVRSMSGLRRYVWWGAGYKPFIVIIWD